MVELTKEELFALRDAWYKEAVKQTVETLPAFIQMLVDYPIRDYNTTVYSTSAATLGTCWAMADLHGITGFQAGCIMWEYITNWMAEYRDKPLRLLNYDKMLYPQFHGDFEKVITPDTWMWLQDQAKKNLVESKYACDEVMAHWQSIVDGKIPFGYRVRDE